MIYILLIGLVTLFSLVFIKSLFVVLKYKLLYGDKVVAIYFPVIGVVFFEFWSYLFKNDNLYFYKWVVNRNPKAKAVISNIFFINILNFVDPEYNREFYQRHDEFVKFKFIPEGMLLSKGIFFSDGLRWKNQRHVLQQSFSFEMLKHDIPIVKNICEDKIIKKPISRQNTSLLQLYSQIAGQVIIDVFFGNDAVIKQEGGDFCYEISDVFREILAMTRNVYYFTKLQVFGKLAFKILATQREKNIQKRLDKLNTLVQKVTQDRIKFHQDQKKEVDSIYFIDNQIKFFLKQKVEINQDIIEQISDQFFSIFFAGTDTTAHTLSFMTYQLAIHPEMQAQMRKETNFEDSKDLDINWIKKLNYSQNIINETLRIFPPVPFLAAKIAIKDMKIKDINIPSGTILDTWIFSSQLNPLYFNQPTKFDPKRWENESALKESFSYTPFSAGPRNCIGQHLANTEMKIVMGYILKNFQLKPIEGKQVKYEWNAIYEFTDDILVEFVKIEK